MPRWKLLNIQIQLVIDDLSCHGDDLNDVILRGGEIHAEGGLACHGTYVRLAVCVSVDRKRGTVRRYIQMHRHLLTLGSQGYVINYVTGDCLSGYASGDTTFFEDDARGYLEGKCEVF